MLGDMRLEKSMILSQLNWFTLSKKRFKSIKENRFCHLCTANYKPDKKLEIFSPSWCCKYKKFHGWEDVEIKTVSTETEWFSYEQQEKEQKNFALCLTLYDIWYYL